MSFYPGRKYMKKLLFAFLIFSNLVAYEQAMFDFFAGLYKFNASEIIDDLRKQITDKPSIVYSDGSSTPLFRAFPILATTISHVTLGDFPTPIMYCDTIGASLGINLYVKDDGVSGKTTQQGKLVGGNKTRKLEFLLADAKARDAETVITVGAAGSNHALATSIYAQLLGLKTICFLRPQANSATVQRNLLLHGYYHTDLRYSPTRLLHGFGIIGECLRQKQITSKFPYFIPVGGSCPLGVLGFVNAVFELKEQILDGQLQEPDRIYVACGSAGTSAGLLLGIKAAGLKSTLIPVRIEPDFNPNTSPEKIVSLAQATNILLHQADTSFPLCDISLDDIHMLDGYEGTNYGVFTTEAKQAIQLFETAESLKLDGTYTGKAASGMLADAQHYKGQIVLFWNTYSGQDVRAITSQIDYHCLPPYLHSYFEQEIPEENRLDF